MNSRQIRRLTYAAVYLALALFLPFLTGQIPEIGSMLCPMHIPVLLCGFVCGAPWGAAVGLIAPLLRSILFGMPRLFPTAIAMCFELAAYGAASGILYRLLPKKVWGVYASLFLAMIFGRIVWGGAQYVLLHVSGTIFTPAMFLAGAVTTAIPGIILHIVVIPVMVLAMEKANLTLNG